MTYTVEWVDYLGPQSQTFEHPMEVDEFLDPHHLEQLSNLTIRDERGRVSIAEIRERAETALTALMAAGRLGY